MTYTVKQLAKLSGVSVRTLHFYDEIALLKPARYGDNGYRYYEREQLLKLQQIMFFRELDMPLAEIRHVISKPEFDRLAALRRHRETLKKNFLRAGELLETVDKTIAALTEGTEMNPKDLYLGFDVNKQREYEEYWIRRGGEGARQLVEEARKNTRDWQRVDFESVKLEFERLDLALADELSKHTPVGAPGVQAIVGRHFRLLQRFYAIKKVAYLGLGQMYLTHPDFRERYDAVHPQLAQYWNDAMRVFAQSLD